MLTEERYATILRILDEKKAATVLDLAKALDASESTVRRDLTALHKSGRLCKVYGGATSIDSSYSASEDDMQTKSDLHREQKISIARKAASLIQADDFVYLDAGSTTFCMIDFIQSENASFVTNGISHAARLSARGFTVIILGGRIKAATEAVVGAGALKSLGNYNFTKGFFGTNGISVKSGFSTPDSGEGLVKEEALKRCAHAYILADCSKFNKVSSVTFAGLSHASIITDVLPDRKYLNHTTIIEGV